MHDTVQIWQLFKRACKFFSGNRLDVFSREGVLNLFAKLALDLRTASEEVASPCKSGS